MGVFSFRQLAVAACWCGTSVSLLRALLVQMAAPAPRTTGRLLAVCPDVAELLAVMVLRKTSLGFIGIYPD
jgi:hypothetical protein